jgi:hypothetical protein
MAEKIHGHSPLDGTSSKFHTHAFQFGDTWSETRLASKTNTKHAGDGVHKGHAVIGRHPGIVVAWG